MPEYVYKCPSCGARFERTLGIKDRNDPQQCDCGVTAAKVVAGEVGAVLRGDVWPGKAQKLKAQMAARRARVGRRESELKQEAPPGGTLVPNVDGEQTDSWGEAAKLASSKGKDSTGYKRRARREKSA